MALKRSNIVVTLLVVANLVFLGWVGRIWIQSLSGGNDGQLEPSGLSQNHTVYGQKAVTQRALSVHLPLPTGTVDELGEGTPCERTQGFLLDASHHLEAAGARPPMSESEIKALAIKKQCSADDPAVAHAISQFRDAWLAAGLEPVGPFTSE